MLNSFREAFLDKLLTSPQQYYSEADFTDKLITEVRTKRENDLFLRGLEHLTVIVILSRCNGLLADRVGGSLATLYMNDGTFLLELLTAKVI